MFRLSLFGFLGRGPFRFVGGNNLILQMVKQVYRNIASSLEIGRCVCERERERERKRSGAAVGFLFKVYNTFVQVNKNV